MTIFYQNAEGQYTSERTQAPLPIVAEVQHSEDVSAALWRHRMELNAREFVRGKVEPKRPPGDGPIPSERDVRKAKNGGLARLDPKSRPGRKYHFDRRRRSQDWYGD